LSLQLEETEEREADLRKMYDKLFQALEAGGIDQHSCTNTPKQKHRRDHQTLLQSNNKDLNSTSGSLFGAQAIESL